MILRFSVLLSYLLHPIFLPLISVFILFQLPIYYNYRFSSDYTYVVYLYLFVNLILVPLGATLYLKKAGFIETFKMTRVKERQVPFLLSAFLHVLTFYVLDSMNFPELYLQIFKAITVTVIILSLLLFINIRWSAHLCAMGGLFGMLVVTSKVLSLNLSLILIPVILISGLLASTRLALNAHNLKEIVLGFFLGLGIQFSLLIEL